MHIEKRLEMLERELASAKRRNRWVMSLLLMLLTLGLINQVYSSHSENLTGNEIRAHQFVLVDETGKVRGRLGMIDNEPTLVLRDDHSEIRLGRRSERLSTFIGINDVRGEIRLGLRSGGDGPVLFLRDERGGEVTDPRLEYRE